MIKSTNKLGWNSGDKKDNTISDDFTFMYIVQ